MMIIALMLSCLITGALGCSDDHCKDPVLGQQLIEVQLLPNREQLGTLCPKMMTFLECEKEFLECSGKSLVELSTSSDSLTKTRANAMLGGIGLVQDMCDDESSFQEDYLNNLECFREQMQKNVDECREDVFKPIERFMDELYPDEEISEDIHIQILCLREAFVAACVVDNLGDACGSDAQRITINVLQRFKGVLGARTCQEVKDSADLKTRFLNFLELDEIRRSNAQGILDLFRRRR